MVTMRLRGPRAPTLAVAALLAAFCVVVAVAGATEIYRWVDAEGTVNFGDRPPENRPAQLIEVRPPMSGLPLADDPEAALGQQRRPEAVIEPAAAAPPSQ